MVKIPANGRSNPVPGNFKVDSFLAREAHGLIWIWYGDPVEPLPEIPFFEELDGFSYGEFHENWNVHYTRAIENQLDVVHLPFVHRTTIGRGNKCLVNGPVVRWEKNRMTYYVKNTPDDGGRPQKAAEIQDYEKLYSLQMQMPNIWQNRVSAKLRIMAAFAPVDEENTMIYLRFCQKIVTVPVLKQIMDCGRTYILLHSSIFYSAKIPFHKAAMYLALMTFNVPLEMLEELCDISVNTAMLGAGGISEDMPPVLVSEQERIMI